MYPCQREVYDAFRASTSMLWVNEIGRQFGKSIIDGVVLLEEGLRKRERVMLYAAPTSVMVRNIFVPNLRILCEDAPENLRPVIVGNEVRFPSTGSVIRMAGCEDELKADRLRGPFAHLAVVDEAGFIRTLDYVIKSVIGPQLQRTRPDSRILVSSTPARRVAHPFTTMCIRAESMGTHIKRSVYDSTHNGTPEKIEEFKALCGDGDPRLGEQTEEWRVEYECNRATFADETVIPEFARNREAIVKPLVPPDYFDPYVGMDLGDSPSLTFIVFGYWDFARAKLCIQREAVLSRPTTKAIAEAVKKAERELWADQIAAWRAERPWRDDVGMVRRVTDIDHRLIADMVAEHDLLWQPARKGDRDAAINRVRMDCGSHRLEIDPSCKQLVSHLEAARWNRARTDFDFEKGFGHFDGIPALMYLRRSVIESSNPWPSDAWQRRGPDEMIVPGAETPEHDALGALGDLF